LCRPERAARPDAASSVAPVASGYERSLRPCLGTSITLRATNEAPPILRTLARVTAEDAIVAEGLEKRYGSVRALAGVTFSVGAGEVFGLLGPNGAGKSTTVRVLTTLTRPDAGRAFVAGHDVVRAPNGVRRSIGYVPQESGVDREATGRENLMLQGRIQGVPRDDLRRRVDELLDLVGIADAADRVVRGYSGGMKRRLDIALGLVHRPSVLFLDEPTTGLDPEARAAMWVEVERLAEQERLTILLTTHYLEEADRLAERVAIVSRGEIVVEGSPEELKRGLRGEAVTVELADGQGEEAVAVVAALDGASETTVDGRLLRTRVPNGAQAVPAILSALESRGVHVESVTTHRPSLDDVYLHYTGREFSSEDVAVRGGVGAAS
jgi:ABC-2 type transport system ATP-binding protein